MENEKINEAKKEKKKSKLPLIILLIVLLLSAGTYYAYAEGYLQPYIDKYIYKVEETPEEPVTETVTKPKVEYTEPTISLKAEYTDTQILFKYGEYIRFSDLVDVTSYKNLGIFSFDLIDEDKSEYTSVGTHSAIITYKDLKGGSTDISITYEVLPEDITDEEVEVIKQKSGHYEERQTVIPAYDEKVITKAAWTEKILVKEVWSEVVTTPAYDEQVMTKAGWTERVLVSEAYDEEITYCSIQGYETQYGYKCTGCGYQTFSGDDILNHIHTTDGCGSYTGIDIPVSEFKCLEYDSYTKHHDAVYDYVWHDPEYTTVHHDEVTKTVTHPAEYNYIQHEAEYEIVHHDEVVKTYQVWVED